VLEGTIKNITEFGMFVGIEDGIDGLIHVSDISWTKKVRHPSEIFKVGDIVQAKVLTVDKDSEKFTLGIKQLSDDPWSLVPSRYPVGSTVSGTVTNITDFGLFIEVEEGIEGLVHVSEVSRKKIKKPSELFQENQVIQAKVIHVSADERRLGPVHQAVPGGRGAEAGSGDSHPAGRKRCWKQPGRPDPPEARGCGIASQAPRQMPQALMIDEHAAAMVHDGPWPLFFRPVPGHERRPIGDEG
jgi:predicted RNA-binding protein with RPS1 domain